MKNLFAVWNHDKVLVKNEEELVEMPWNLFLKTIKDTNIFASNIPVHLCEALKEKGATIYRCNPNIIAEYRKGRKKSDELDVTLLYKIAKNEPEKFTVYRTPPVITHRYSQFKLVQELRKRLGNQVWATATPDEFGVQIVGQLKATEAAIIKDVAKEVKTFDIWKKWLVNVKGVGPSIAGALIGTISKIGIDQFNKPSSLRKYCGLGVTNGKADHRKKGEKINYNPEMKSMLLGVLPGQFLKAKGFYSELYYQEKERQLAKVYAPGFLKSKWNGYKVEDTQLLKGHAHNRALRWTVKIFLNHLWVIWRQLEGLPTRSDYQFEYMQHSQYISPPDIPDELLPFEPFKELAN